RGYLTYCYFGNEYSFSIEMKVEVIGKDQVVQRSFIPVELFLISVLLKAIQILIANILGFDKSHRNILACQNIIRRTAALSFRLIRRSDGRHHRFNELLQISSEGMFCGIAGEVAKVERGDVEGWGHGCG